MFAFTLSLLVYMFAMYAIGYLASRRVNDVDDYVLAGGVCRSA